MIPENLPTWQTWVLAYGVLFVIAVMFVIALCRAARDIDPLIDTAIREDEQVAELESWLLIPFGRESV